MQAFRYFLRAARRRLNVLVLCVLGGSLPVDSSCGTEHLLHPAYTCTLRSATSSVQLCLYCSYVQVDIVESILQVFTPNVLARQQAFTALGAEPSVQQEVRVPAEWQLATNNAVSLAIGAGK